MASIINTVDIDTAYPVAGQDNDSQGFRDNFTLINTNFVAAKNEIQALQSVVLPLYTGTGSPNGVVTAPVGSLYTNSTGSTNTTLYVKEIGTDSNGWVAK